MLVLWKSGSHCTTFESLLKLLALAFPFSFAVAWMCFLKQPLYFLLCIAHYCRILGIHRDVSEIIKA